MKLIVCFLFCAIIVCAKASPIDDYDDEDDEENEENADEYDTVDAYDLFGARQLAVAATKDSPIRRVVRRLKENAPKLVRIAKKVLRFLLVSPVKLLISLVLLPVKLLFFPVKMVLWVLLLPVRIVKVLVAAVTAPFKVIKRVLSKIPRQITA